MVMCVYLTGTDFKVSTCCNGIPLLEYLLVRGIPCMKFKYPHSPIIHVHIDTDTSFTVSLTVHILIVLSDHLCSFFVCTVCYVYKPNGSTSYEAG